MGSSETKSSLFVYLSVCLSRTRDISRRYLQLTVASELRGQFVTLCIIGYSRVNVMRARQPVSG